MEQTTKFRHNSTIISDIRTFESIEGEITHDYKDVYFVRAIGVNASYVQDIQRLDDFLLGKMNAGRGYYYRSNGLARMQSIEDTNFYSKCYEAWTDNGRKEIFTKATQRYKPLAEMLSCACVKVEALFLQDNRQATASIVKNFIVKLLFWYDSIFTDERFHYEEKSVMKIVASDIIKRQEYFFFYLVTLMGCDVLLLQGRGDISVEEEKLGLSSKFVLGEFAEAAVPAYQWRETRNVQSEQGGYGQSVQTTLMAQQSLQDAGNSNGRITIKLPERNRPAKRPAQNLQSTGTQSTGLNSQPGMSATQGNPRVVIPPRPGSKPRNTQPSAATGQAGTRESQRGAVSPRTSGTDRAVSTGSNVEKSFEELAMLASSVVLITVYDDKGERLGSGSGIMIGKEGYILTNNHVAAGGRCFSVRIEDDDKEYRTDEIIKYHSVLDLAIIRIQRKLNPIPIYKGSKPLVRGQKVVAIGSPLGLFNSVSDGIISGFRKIDAVDMIQFTAPTSRGSSGGAVLNMQGEVIGISTAGIDAGQNINLAMGYECINMFIKGFI